MIILCTTRSFALVYVLSQSFSTDLVFPVALFVDTAVQLFELTITLLHVDLLLC